MSLAKHFSMYDGEQGVNATGATADLAQLLSPRQFARDFLSRKLATEFGEQYDADNLYAVTAEYTSKRPGEHHFAQLLRKVNLVDIFIDNVLAHHFGLDGGNISLKILTKRAFDDYAGTYHPQRGKRVHFTDNKSYPSEIITNIYPDNVEDSSVFRNRVPVSIDKMTELLKTLDAEQLYKDYLDDFWARFGQADFDQAFCDTLFHGLASQVLEGSLAEEDQNLVLAFLGKVPEEDWTAKYADLDDMENLEGQALQAGYVTVAGSYQSAMLFIRHPDSSRIVLYVPGNSSPFHSFGSDTALQDWIGQQAAESSVRAQLAQQFSLLDQAGGFSFGATTILTKIGRYAQLFGTNQNPVWEEDDARNWSPRVRLSLTSANDILEQAYQRTKERTYSDGRYVISNNADVTKKSIIKRVEEIGLVLGIASAVLLPFATPVVAATVTGAFGALGAVQAGIGIDDQIQGKPGATTNLVWGLLNALPLAAIAGKAALVASSQIDELLHNGALYYVGKTRHAKLAESAYELYRPAGANVYLRTGQVLDVLSSSQAVRRYSAEALASQINNALEHLRAPVVAAELTEQIASRGIYTSAGRYFVKVGEEAETAYYQISADSLGRDAVKLVDPRTGHGQKFLAWDGEKWQMPSLLGGGNAASRSVPSVPLVSVKRFDLPVEDIADFEWLMRDRSRLFPNRIPEKLDATSKRPYETVRPAFFERRNELLATAETYLPRKFKEVTRPPVPAISRDAKPAGFIKTIYEHSDGMVLGENYYSMSSKEFIVTHLDRFKEHNVKTLYLANVFSDIHQGDLNALFSKAGKITKHRLKSYLNQLDYVHGTDVSPFCSYFNLVKSASKKGIRVIAIDSTTSYGWMHQYTAKNPERIKMLNWYAQDIINSYQAEAGQGQKWLALVGSAHVNTFENIPGLAELTGATGVIINDGESVTKTAFGARFATPYQIEIAGEEILLKPDFVYEVPNVRPVTKPFGSQKNDFRINTVDAERPFVEIHTLEGEVTFAPIRFDAGYYMSIDIPGWYGLHNRRFKTLKDLIQAIEQTGKRQVTQI